MSEQQKHTELLKEQSQSENQNTNNNGYSERHLKPEELEYHKEITDGIWVRGNTRDGYCVTMGQFRISKIFYATPWDAEKAVRDKDWDILINMVFAIQMFNTSVDKETQEKADKYDALEIPRYESGPKE